MYCSVQIGDNICHVTCIPCCDWLRAIFVYPLTGCIDKECAVLISTYFINISCCGLNYNIESELQNLKMKESEENKQTKEGIPSLWSLETLYKMYPNVQDKSRSPIKWEN